MEMITWRWAETTPVLARPRFRPKSRGGGGVGGPVGELAVRFGPPPQPTAVQGVGRKGGTEWARRA